MTLQIAFQIDPVQKLNIQGDTSFALALEAQKRNFEIFTYQPRNMFVLEGQLFAQNQKTSFRDQLGDHATLDEIQTKKLTEFDVILMRQDPPFDMHYITATYLLELVCQEVLIVNDPVSVRHAPEKILPLRFAHLMPPTLISSSLAEITKFRQTYQNIILKPLYGAGGKGVVLIEKNNRNYLAIAEMMLNFYRLPLIAQKFLPEVRLGDKRIILIDGEPVAALNRVPADQEIRANLAAGATCHLAKLDSQDKKICDALRQTLVQMGILFAGIDVIDGCLTEINITSPTGFRQIQELGGPDCASLFWDVVLKKLHNNS